jgi:hypothetical protein
MKHIVFFSGGIGSFFTAKRVIEKEGKENVILLFTDTLIEDEDLYRFMNDASQYFEIPITRLADGRTPWEVFKDVKFLGNSRIAHCSHLLKQVPADKWVRENFNPDECVLYLGIDWTEIHRTKKPKENYLPYKVKFPMCDEPYITKNEMLEELEKIGIEQPKLYKMGFSHNNCGGGCVRAGQGHFAHLLETMHDKYKEWEEHEEEIREYLGKDVSMMKRSKVVWKLNKYGRKYKDTDIERLTLKRLREEIESKQTENIDFQDIGGCGCFIGDND